MDTKRREIEGVSILWRIQEQAGGWIASWIASRGEHPIASLLMECAGDEARVVSWEADDLTAAERAVCLREGLAAIATFVDRSR